MSLSTLELLERGLELTNKLALNKDGDYTRVQWREGRKPKICAACTIGFLQIAAQEKDVKQIDAVQERSAGAGRIYIYDRETELNYNNARTLLDRGLMDIDPDFYDNLDDSLNAIPDWNDRDETKKEDVRNLYRRAIELAKGD